MRVLICGSRDWADREAIAVVLNGLLHADSFEDLVVIDGGAKGADAAAREWYGGAEDGLHAVHKRVTHETYPAEWETYGKSAGPVRNRRMLDEGKPDLVWAFKAHEESRGTNHMVNLARKAGVPTYVVSAATPSSDD